MPSMQWLMELDPFSAVMAPLFLMVTVSLFLEPLWSSGANRRDELGPFPSTRTRHESSVEQRRAA
jgi:hypothetical protein